MASKINRDDRNVPFIVKSGSTNRGTIRVIHIQAEQNRDGMSRTTLCNRTVHSLDWRIVSATEFRGQMMVCERCERKA